MNIPDEYICNLCGYEFFYGEVPELFCPNCGSSMVTKELNYDEYFDDEVFLNTFRIINI